MHGDDASQERYFHTEAIGIVEVDAQQRILRANEGAQAIFGLTAEEFRARSWVDLVHPDDLQKVSDHFQADMQRLTKGTSLEVRCRADGGRIVDAVLNIQPGDAGDDGKPLYYIAFILDVTHMRSVERELRRLSDHVDALQGKIGNALQHAINSRDPYTAGHQDHVADLTAEICRVLGVDEYDTYANVMAARVHDIGKISIPSQYLSKPGALDDLERAIIRTHAQHSYYILRPIETDFPIAEIAYQHHERLDGSGYPRGLKNGEIHRGAQIIAVADTVDSIVNSRPYRAGLGPGWAINILGAERGARLQADVVDACIDILKKMPQEAAANPHVGRYN